VIGTTGMCVCVLLCTRRRRRERRRWRHRDASRTQETIATHHWLQDATRTTQKEERCRQVDVSLPLHAATLT